MAHWKKIKSRGNVDDRRAMTAGKVGTVSITSILLLMGVSYLMGGNPLDVLSEIDPNELQSQQSQAPVDTTEFEGVDEYEEFASIILGSNNDAWREIFAENNMTYTAPQLVLFRNQTTSACGGASALSGPHYCPGDNTIYLDETFFEELQRRFGAEGGDVAEAYVIAHEVGHHVQNLLNTISSRRSNEESIKTELQADCFAGLWAYSIKEAGIFEQNEIREAIDAAAAVGDDNIQKKTQGKVSPESWTHGSSDDRVNAFNTGFLKGSFQACNT